MFGMDPDYWEKYHSQMRNSNLVKGNVGEDPDRWGGLPEELHPGFTPKIDVDSSQLDNYMIPERLGGGYISIWRLLSANTGSDFYVLAREVSVKNPGTGASKSELWLYDAVNLTISKDYIDLAVKFGIDDRGLYNHTALYTSDRSDISSRHLYDMLQKWNNGTNGLFTTTSKLKKFADELLIDAIKESGVK